MTIQDTKVYTSGRKIAAMGLFLLVGSNLTHAAERMKVTVIEREGVSTHKSVFLAGTSNSTTTTNVNCNDAASACSGTTHHTGFTSPAHEVSKDIEGAKLTLELPDGRIAIVGCTGKFDGWSAIATRDCRVPPLDDIQAEFNGKNAKLIWTTSLDGKKTTSETYKVLAVKTR